MSSKNILFFSTVGNKIGIGHYKRLQNLSQYPYFKKNNKSFYVLNVDKSNILNKKFKIRSKKSFNSFNFKNNYNYSFLDLSNEYSYKNKNEILNIFYKIKKVSKKIILIDCIGKYKLAQFISKYIYIDFILSPYLNEIKSSNYRFINGYKYTILSSKLINYSKKIQFNNIAKRITLTFGGSDIYECNLSIINILNKIDEEINLSIIIGPFFAKNYIKKIKIACDKGPHKYKLIKNSLNLYPIFYKSDLIIVGSGLTKYEISSTGIPQIIISSSNEDEKYNLPFKKNGLSTINLHKNTEVYNLKIIKNIISNRLLRKKISENGKNYIDNNGVKRFLKKIKFI